METKSELLAKAIKLGIDGVNIMNRQKLRAAIDAREAELSGQTDSSEKQIGPETPSTKKTRASDIIKARRGGGKQYPIHHLHGVLQPNAHGLSTGGDVE